MIDGSGHGGHDGAGIDIGHASGLGSADLGVGHGHGHNEQGHFGGHHGGINHDGKVTVEALMVAHSHSGAPNFSNFGHVNSSVDAHSGMPDHGHVGSDYSADGVDRSRHSLKSEDVFFKAVEAAKNDPMRRVYGVHVLSHGNINLTRAFAELGTKLGANRVCGTTGNFNPIDIALNDLTDWSKFTPPYSRRRPPAGWYPKAQGLTHVWRQYWQMAKKKPLFCRRKGRPAYDRSQSTYLEINIVTWFYAEIGDYETRIDMKIVTLPILDEGDKQWAIRGDAMRAHQNLAAKLEKGLFEDLKFARPDAEARRKRGKLIELQTTRPADVDKSGADLDTLFGTVPDENLLRQQAQEAVAAAASSTPAAVTPAAVTPPPPAAVPVSEAPKLTGKDVAVKVEIPPPVLRN